jgi:hypothetical protein
MASPNISEIATSTMEARSGKVRDNVSDNNAILFRLKDKAEEPVDGGTEIREEIEYAENSAGQWYSGAEVLSVASSDVFSSASFSWKQYAIAVVMNGLEKLQNSGEAAIFNLLAKRIVNAEHTMKNAIALGLYSDGTTFGGKTLTGLGAAVPQDPTTGTYGGINRADHTFWRSQLNDPGSTPTTSTILPEMNTVWVSCVRGSDHPDLVMAGSTIFKTFLGALQPNQRFTDPKLASAGFTTVKYMNADVVLDGGVGGNGDAEDMVFLNTKYIHWRPHARRNMTPDPEKRFATNQDATVQFLLFAGNLTTSAQFVHGRLKGD